MLHSRILLFSPHLKIVATWGKGPAGRFGGGFNWKIGVQAGASTLIVSLLTVQLRVDLDPPVHVPGPVKAWVDVAHLRGRGPVTTHWPDQPTQPGRYTREDDR